MTLSEKQFDVINFVEQEYLLNGAIPTAARVASLGLVNEKKYTEWLADPEFRRNLVARGISPSVVDGNDKGILTEEQLTVANVMLDLTDNRSRKKKLADLKISTQKYEAWLRDPAFQHYLRTRAENILGDNLHESHLALLDRVRAGDMSAIKYYNEITGRYIQNNGDSIDLAGLLMRILEIIQKHVSNNDEVAKIADEMLTLASGVGIGRVGSVPQRRELVVNASEI